MTELVEMLEDSLTEIIEDSIDMDWTSRWGAKAITRKLQEAGADETFLRRLDELLS